MIFDKMYFFSANDKDNIFIGTINLPRFEKSSFEVKKKVLILEI